jgi:hypothetical protein
MIFSHEASGGFRSVSTAESLTGTSCENRRLIDKNHHLFR